MFKYLYHPNFFCKDMGSLHKPAQNCVFFCSFSVRIARNWPEFLQIFVNFFCRRLLEHVWCYPEKLHCAGFIRGFGGNKGEMGEVVQAGSKGRRHLFIHVESWHVSWPVKGKRIEHAVKYMVKNMWAQWTHTLHTTCVHYLCASCRYDTTHQFPFLQDSCHVSSCQGSWGHTSSTRPLGASLALGDIPTLIQLVGWWSFHLRNVWFPGFATSTYLIGWWNVYEMYMKCIWNVYEMYDTYIVPTTSYYIC